MLHESNGTVHRPKKQRPVASNKVRACDPRADRVRASLRTPADDMRGNKGELPLECDPDCMSDSVCAEGLLLMHVALLSRFLAVDVCALVMRMVAAENARIRSWMCALLPIPCATNSSCSVSVPRQYRF